MGMVMVMGRSELIVLNHHPTITPQSPSSISPSSPEKLNVSHPLPNSPNFIVQLQELALLNSSLLRRPTIQKLVSVIEPLITEFTPLTQNELTSFTRSSISHGVLQNLLAHVTVAEQDAFSSEAERQRIVEDDIDFGPDNVGDNYVDGPVANDDIVAAKGLIDLFRSIIPHSFVVGNLTR
jgi:hypothetical protein